MTALMPYPILSAFLLGLWLLLNQSLSPGHLLLGSAVGIAGGLAISTLQIPSGRLHRLTTGFRLALTVLFDIIRSNIAVTRIILTPTHRMKSGFVTIPLDLRDHYGLAILACIITSTPGTVWVNYDSARGVLLIHVLDLIDEAAWVDLIKNRYERSLMEIFE
ncbi:MAG: Na+/H+ antiporter subunit E [Hyphomicrobiaceae bacterium]